MSRYDWLRCEKCRNTRHRTYFQLADKTYSRMCDRCRTKGKS